VALRSPGDLRADPTRGISASGCLGATSKLDRAFARQNDVKVDSLSRFHKWQEVTVRPGCVCRSV